MPGHLITGHTGSPQFFMHLGQWFVAMAAMLVKKQCVFAMLTEAETSKKLSRSLTYEPNFTLPP